MSIEYHPVPRRPIEAILAARRCEKAALAARCRAFGAIAEALAHYGRDRGPTLTDADRRGCWEQLGEHVGAAASARPAASIAAPDRARHPPGGEHPHERHGAPARRRARTLAGAAS